MLTLQNFGALKKLCFGKTIKEYLINSTLQIELARQKLWAAALCKDHMQESNELLGVIYIHK